MMNISPVPEKLLVSPVGAKASSVAAETVSEETTIQHAASKVKNAENDQELRKACADFEALFLHKLLKVMRQTVPESGLLDGGLSQDIYTDMLDEKLAEIAAHNGRGTGLGEHIYQDMKRAYGAQAHRSTGAYGHVQGGNSEVQR